LNSHQSLHTEFFGHGKAVFFRHEKVYEYFSKADLYRKQYDGEGAKDVIKTAFCFTFLRY
jgi:hypothetical protein